MSWEGGLVCRRHWKQEGQQGRSPRRFWPNRNDLCRHFNLSVVRRIWNAPDRRGWLTGVKHSYSWSFGIERNVKAKICVHERQEKWKWIRYNNSENRCDVISLQIQQTSAFWKSSQNIYLICQFSLCIWKRLDYTPQWHLRRWRSITRLTLVDKSQNPNSKGFWKLRKGRTVLESGVFAATNDCGYCDLRECPKGRLLPIDVWVDRAHTRCCPTRGASASGFFHKDANK